MHKPILFRFMCPIDIRLGYTKDVKVNLSILQHSISSLILFCFFADKDGEESAAEKQKKAKAAQKKSVNKKAPKETVEKMALCTEEDGKGSNR